MRRAATGQAVRRQGLRGSALVLSLALVLAAAVTPDARESDALYRDLGAGPGVTKLVNAFLLQLADDERVAHRFVETDIRRFRRMLGLQLCVVSGGPCTYSGDDMATTHAGLAIREAEFNAVVECLMNAMDQLDLPVGIQNRLLARLAPMHRDIVGR